MLCLLNAAVHSQDSATTEVAGPGVNFLLFAANSPSPTSGGVDVSLTIQPAPTYTCTSVTISIVDPSTNKTLATQTFTNPGATVNQSFNGLANNLPVQVVVDSVFQSGSNFDFPYLSANVTTQ